MFCDERVPRGEAVTKRWCAGANPSGSSLEIVDEALLATDEGKRRYGLRELEPGEVYDINDFMDYVNKLEKVVSERFGEPVKTIRSYMDVVGTLEYLASDPSDLAVFGNYRPAGHATFKPDDDAESLSQLVLDVEMLDVGVLERLKSGESVRGRYIIRLQETQHGRRQHVSFFEPEEPDGRATHL
jgi:hypothetical protein